MKIVLIFFFHSKNRQKSQKHRIDMGIFSLDRFFSQLSNDIRQHRVSYKQFQAIILQREKKIVFPKSNFSLKICQKSQNNGIETGIFLLDRFFPDLSNDIRQHRVSYYQFRAIILQREKEK